MMPTWRTTNERQIFHFYSRHQGCPNGGRDFVFRGRFFPQKGTGRFAHHFLGHAQFNSPDARQGKAIMHATLLLTRKCFPPTNAHPQLYTAQCHIVSHHGQARIALPWLVGRSN